MVTDEQLRKLRRQLADAEADNIKRKNVSQGKKEIMNIGLRKKRESAELKRKLFELKHGKKVRVAKTIGRGIFRTGKGIFRTAKKTGSIINQITKEKKKKVKTRRKRR